METLEEYLARGGRVERVQVGKSGQKEDARKRPKGYELKQRLRREARNSPYLANGEGGGK